MTCPACGQPTTPGKRFCGACGAPVPSTCLTCGSLIRPGKRFCEDCGSALVVNTVAVTDASARVPAPATSHSASLAAPTATIPLPPPAGPPPAEAADLERRLVTIVFADLVDSTVLGEQLDPEEVRDLIGVAHEALARTVARYGGHVAQYLGDGVMVLFGAPIAREDDAERAVLA